MYRLAHSVAAADRAAQQLRLLLLLEIGSRAKPTLERMVVAASQIKNDHALILCVSALNRKTTLSNDKFNSPSLPSSRRV
jgi:hypothetical protein